MTREGYMIRRRKLLVHDFFYESIFSTSFPFVVVHVCKVVKDSVTDEMKERLEAEFTKEEVYEALKKMKPNLLLDLMVYLERNPSLRVDTTVPLEGSYEVGKIESVLPFVSSHS